MPTCVHCGGASGHPVLPIESRHERARESDIFAAHMQARPVDVCLPCITRIARYADKVVDEHATAHAETVEGCRLCEWASESVVDRARIGVRLATFAGPRASLARHARFHATEVDGCPFCKQDYRDWRMGVL